MDPNRWNTEEVKDLLKDERWDIDTTRPGGDYDTTTLILKHKDSPLWKEEDFGDITEDTRASLIGHHKHKVFVCGFLAETPMGDPDDHAIDMVEVNDGEDSSGGLNTDDEPTAIMYGVVCSRLRKAGYVVVKQMKDYF